jgi:signal peptidase I
MQPHKIKGASMEPNFPDGEYLLTDKLSYRFREPKRGEVIVFEAPRTNGEEFIKRIIGLPGENVSVRNGSVYINNKKLDEQYLNNSVLTGSGSFLTEGKQIIVPENNYFVLGDNRSASSDSRMWGFVSKDKITGRAFVTYWPPPEVGLIHAAEYNVP